MQTENLMMQMLIIYMLTVTKTKDLNSIFINFTQVCTIITSFKNKRNNWMNNSSNQQTKKSQNNNNLKNTFMEEMNSTLN